jgi:hypothetical protein
MQMPQAIQDRKKWLLEMVREVIEKIEQGAAAKIIWVNQGRKNESEIPMAEIKMESKEVARRIRLKFAEKKDWGRTLERYLLLTVSVWEPE